MQRTLNTQRAAMTQQRTTTTNSTKSSVPTAEASSFKLFQAEAGETRDSTLKAAAKAAAAQTRVTRLDRR